MMFLENLFPDDVKVFSGSGLIRLYHGSKGGISGKIRHDFDASRTRCDFGRGFYLGTNPKQAKTLASSHPHSVFYEIDLNLENLACLEVRGLPWVLLIAWNRGFLTDKNAPLLADVLRKDSEIIDREIDVVSGLIADDQMTVVLRKFFANALTDIGVEECLKCIKYETQFTLKSEKAAKATKIVKSGNIFGQEKSFLEDIARKNVARSEKLVTEIQLRTFPKGRLFGHIVNDIEETLRNDEHGRGRPDQAFHL